MNDTTSIQRKIGAYVRSLAGMFPVVSVQGPRQSGKTTLVRSLFQDSGQRLP